MGCLGTVYVPACHHEYRLRTYVVLGSILCSCLLMWTYKRINKEKEEQCAREGIDESKEDLYRDLADKSPLFR